MSIVVLFIKIKEFESLCKTMHIWKSLMKVIILEVNFIIKLSAGNTS